MLTPGNKKLGRRLIWGFGLPSGRPDLCVGLSAQCLRHCRLNREFVQVKFLQGF